MNHSEHTGKIQRIGLTGGIASGKSTVAAILREKGYRVVDADAIAHRLMQPGHVNYDGIVAAFGTDLLDENGAIDRRKLGRIVFSDKKALQKLEAIVHPNICTAMLQEADTSQSSPEELRAMQSQANSVQYEGHCKGHAKGHAKRNAKGNAEKNAQIVFFDIPLLFEKPEWTSRLQLDKTWLVWTNPERQLARIRSRDGLSEKEALQRIENQMPIDEKVALADVVIKNDEDLEWLKKEIEAELEE